MTTGRALHIEHLEKIYANGTHAVKDVSLTIEEGDFFALLGANGAGKTTIIGVLTGLVTKTSGKVYVFGRDIDAEFAQARLLIGVVPQEFNFNMFEKVQDILVNQAGYFGIERNEARPRAETLLKRLELWDKRHWPSRALSGGMKRRLMIARALMHEPRFLILDEPTAGVDVELRHGMWDYLRKLNEEGVTVLLTTHYLEEVEQMCRHAAIIKNGALVRCDKVSRLVQFLDEETYIIEVKELKNVDRLKGYPLRVVDRHTLEVQLNRKKNLHEFLMRLSQAGMVIVDIRTQGFRLERLFLNILRT